MQTKLDILINAKGEYQALDEAKKRVFALKAEFGALSSSLAAGAGLSIGAGLMSSFAAACKEAATAGVSFNANIEKQTASFKTLLGSSQEATARMRELARFAAATPFELPQLVAASRTLQTFGGNALAAGAGLKLVGDAASAVNAPIAEASMWMGRLFAGLRQGTSLGEPIQNLTQLGLISGELRQKLAALQGQALSEAAAMDVLQSAFGRYAGAMQAQSSTFEGLTSTLADNFKMLQAEVSKPVFDVLKESLIRANEVLASDGVAEGLKVAARGLADFVGAAISAGEVIAKFSDYLVLAAATWAALKIGRWADGMLGYVASLNSAQTAEVRMVQAVEAEVAALTSKQAALSRLVQLQGQLNALQLMGNTGATMGTASAWAPGVRNAAASDTLAHTRSIEAMNTAMRAAPGLMSRVAAGGRAMFAALGGWGTVAVAGMFAIEWWKNWKLEAIDALDNVRDAAATRLRELRAEIAGVTTELQRQLVLSRVRAQLHTAKASPEKFTAQDVEMLQRMVDMLERTPATAIAARAQAKPGASASSADPVPQIDTLLLKQEDALQRRNRLQRDFNGLTADQVLAQRRASEELIADLKRRQDGLRGTLAPLESQRSQLGAYSATTPPPIAPGEMIDLPAGWMTDSTKKKGLKRGAGFVELSDEDATAYEAGAAFAREKSELQKAVTDSQAEYNRLKAEESDLAAKIAETEGSMPRAEKLAEYIQVAKEANRITEAEAAELKDLQLQRQLLGADDAKRIQILTQEIMLGEAKVATMAEGREKEQALLAVEKNRVEVQTLLDRQAKEEMETALRIAQIKQGAAQREREAIEKRRVDGKLSLSDQQLLASAIEREKGAIDELITAYERLKQAKGTSTADVAAADDTIAALNQEKDTLGMGSPAEPTRMEQSQNQFAEAGNAQNSFQSPGDAITGGMMDLATEAGTVWNNLHDSVMQVGAAMENGISNSLQGLINRTMSWKQALSNIGSTIMSSIVSSIATMFAKWVVGELMLFALRTVLRKKEDQDSTKSAGIKAVEGGMKSISQLGPIWGTIAFVGALAAIFAITSSIGSRATGGPIASGSPYLVGEYGPELIVPSESAVVMNHKETASVAERLGAGAGGGSTSGRSGPSTTVIVDNRREADAYRRGSPMEVQILETVQRNRYRIFSS